MTDRQALLLCLLWFIVGWACGVLTVTGWPPVTRLARSIAEAAGQTRAAEEAMLRAVVDWWGEARTGAQQSEEWARRVGEATKRMDAAATEFMRRCAEWHRLKHGRPSKPP